MSLLVLNIKRSLDKNHAISERDARLLIVTIEAYEKQVEELKAKLAQVEKAKAEASS